MNIDDLSLEEIQSRILAGETYSEDEYRRIIEKYRGDRRSAAATSAKARAPKAKADFDLFEELNQAMGR